MKTLLINAHPDPHAADSATHQMVQHLLGQLPAGSVEVLNLAEATIPPLDKAVRNIHIKTVFTQAPLNAAEETLAARMRELVAQFTSASRLIIAMPMYNFGIPARLKDWVDNIVVPGQTFRYSENGQPQGLMAGHKALILITSGSVFSQGGFAHMDFTAPYLQALLGSFLGFDSVDVVRIEGTNAPAIGMQAALNKAFAELNAKLPGFLAN